MFDPIPQVDRPLDAVARTEARKAAFLSALGPRGWRAALAEAEINDEQVYRWIRLDPAFKAALDDTRHATAVRLEQIADAIASGEIDAAPAQVTLIQFRLRGLKPDVYRDRSSVQVESKVQISAGGDGSRARTLLAEWSVVGNGGGGNGGAAVPPALPAAAPR